MLRGGGEAIGRVDHPTQHRSHRELAQCLGLPTPRDVPNASQFMPIEIAAGTPTLLIRREAFERVGLTRARIDERLNLTADEFRVDGQLIAVGPLVGETALEELVSELEGLGLVYFDDFFELSGNWPEWLRLYARTM